jgi:hypothetical protein
MPKRHILSRFSSFSWVQNSENSPPKKIQVCSLMYLNPPILTLGKVKMTFENEDDSELKDSSLTTTPL